jgi:two-component system OmpR family response regulator
MSKTMIVSHVWITASTPAPNAVDVLVHRLREQNRQGFRPELLHTVRGVGYVLKVE